MREKTNVDIEAIKFLYKRYKEYLVPSLVIFICILLFFIIIIPQIKDLINISKQRDTELKKLKILKNNLNILANINSSVLDSQFDVISSALPPNKDFTGIITGISGAVQRSGVSLSDFEFAVGDLTETEVTSGEFPFLNTKLNIQSSYQQSADFITELFKSFPLAEITDVSLSGSSTEISVVFYYKPMPVIEIDNYKPIKILSKNNLDLINELSAWNSVSALNISFPASSTPAGSFSPF